jgi:purine-binding chemotaxis protein CheW
MSTGAEETALLVVVLEGRRFAFRLEHVQEVLPLVEPVQVPGWPRYGLGLMRVRGEVVPLVDLRSTLQLSDVALDSSQKIVVVLAAGVRWGVLVSAVAGVVSCVVRTLAALAPQPRLVRPEVSFEVAAEPEGLTAVLDPTAMVLTLGLPLPAEALA